MKKKILIVEDEVNLMEVLEDTLLEENFEIFKAYEGSAAIDMFYEVNPDLVLLDINLPKKDGWTICKEIRNDSNKPIIIMTARDTELDELKGLSIGADDYITKPFSLKILTLRIKKLLKIENEDYYLYETLRFNFGTYELIIDSQNIEITKKESLFLDYIIKNKNTSRNITVRRTTKKAEGKIRQKAISFEIAFCTRSIKVTIYCMGNIRGIRKMVIMASIIAKGVPHFK